jgi:hypothetical protein
MSTRSALRRLVVLLGTTVALIPLNLQSLPAAAASTGTLFGIASGPNGNVLVKVDPSSGAETQLTDLSVPGAIDAQSSSLASDPATHRLFLVRTVVTGFDPSTGFPIFEFQLVTVNSQTGAIVSSPSMTGAASQWLAFDTSTNTLFGFTGQQVVRVDPSTGSQTTFATLPSSFASFIYSIAIARASHTLFVSREDVSGPVETQSTQIIAIDTKTGAMVTGPSFTPSVRSITYDPSWGALFGVTDASVPFSLLGIDPSSGATTFVASLGSNSTQPYWMTTDPGSQTVFMDLTTFDPTTFSQQDQMLSINDQTGAELLSPSLAQGIGSLVFETPVVITPDSIKTDVRSALSSGAITNAGVANSLLAKLNAASDARSRGQCATAARDYQAFIHELSAQSGKHVASSTASQLAGEAQFLIANCP